MTSSKLKDNILDNSSSLLLIDPSQPSCVKDASFDFLNKEDIDNKSEEAINKAIDKIQDMAKRINSVINGIDDIIWQTI